MAQIYRNDYTIRVNPLLNEELLLTLFLMQAPVDRPMKNLDFSGSSFHLISLYIKNKQNIITHGLTADLRTEHCFVTKWRNYFSEKRIFSVTETLKKGWKKKKIIPSYNLRDLWKSTGAIYLEYFRKTLRKKVVSRYLYQNLLKNSLGTAIFTKSSWRLFLR